MSFGRVESTFPDTHARSATGRFELRTRAGVVTLLERGGVGARERWTSATIHAGSPKHVWVSELGWSAVLYGDDTLVLLDPAGARVAQTDVLALLLEDPDSKAFLRQTNDDVLLWDSDPLGVFAITSYGAPCFFVRCYWGRRVLLHAGAPRGTLELSTVAQSTIVGRELALATELLTEALGRPETEGTPGRFCAAAVLLGLEGGREAAALLERVSALPVEDYDFASSVHDVRMPSGELESLEYAWNLLPMLCTWALVRLGHRPPRGAGYGFCWDEDDDDDEDSYDWDEDYVFEPRPEGWLAALSRLREGLTHAEVLARVGAPTFIRWRTSTWCYDDVGCTHALRFEAGVVVEITRDHEQRWRTTLEYEQSLLS
ncbi:MAG: hypothetical protein H6713_41520 [Myxococcales bacterium]|nr:hypothetical protein [Myxococcales bacterium]